MFNERTIKKARGGSVVDNRRWFRLIQAPMYISNETTVSRKGNELMTIGFFSFFLL